MASTTSVPRCQHIKVNGVQCGCPALRQKKYCYFHHTWREKTNPHSTNRRRAQRRTNGQTAIMLPPLEDANAIQMAIMEVLYQLAEGHIASKQAGLMLYALQTASVNLKHLSFEPEWRKVVVNPGAARFSAVDISQGASDHDCKRSGDELTRLADDVEAEMNPELAVVLQKPDPAKSATAVVEETAQFRHALPMSPKAWEDLKGADLTAYLLSTLALKADDGFYLNFVRGLAGRPNDMTPWIEAGRNPEAEDGKKFSTMEGDGRVIADLITKDL